MDCSLSGRNVLTDVVIHSIGGRHRRRPSIGLLDMEGHSTSVAMAITPIFIVDITSSISDDVTYLRNNKAEGEKNVRCFPQCNSDGHCSSSFCGSSIKATLSAAHIGDSTELLKSLFIVGEFIPSDSQPTILEESIRTESELSKPGKYSKLYKAEMTFSDSTPDGSENTNYAQLEFNSKAKSWGYSYVAHRFKKESKHQFSISILSLISNSISSNDAEKSYKCVGTFRSAEFQIQCKRRAICVRSKRKQAVRPQTIKMMRAASACKRKNCDPLFLLSRADVSPLPPRPIILPYDEDIKVNLFPINALPPMAIASPDHAELFLPSKFSSRHPRYHTPTPQIVTENEIQDSYDNMISADMSSRNYVQSPWPQGVGPHPFTTPTGADYWTPISDPENPRGLSASDRCLSSHRIALLQQLFADDISVFCCK